MRKPGSARSPSSRRPNVFGYHDYRALLRDWVDFLKTQEQGFSVRELSRRAGLAVGFLPMVFSGKYELTPRALSKLAPVLAFDSAELNYFEYLVELNTAPTPEGRLRALAKMKSYKGYRRSNPNEIEAFGYWNKWYHAAIREMALLPGFKADPHWIKEKLKFKVSAGEIEEALRFLVDNHYIELNPEGAVVPPKDLLHCEGSVFKTVLTCFHKQMFSLAAESIDNTPASQRSMLGYTLAIDFKDFEKARKILDDALGKLRELSGTPSSNSVYHFELALFPLTKEDPGAKKEEA